MRRSTMGQVRFSNLQPPRQACNEIEAAVVDAVYSVVVDQLELRPETINPGARLVQFMWNPALQHFCQNGGGVAIAMTGMPVWDEVKRAAARTIVFPAVIARLREGKKK